MGHDGVVTVVTGAQDIGTGVTTAFAQVAAEELGLPLDRVRVEVGSTRYGVYAPVSGGSQTMPSVAPAVRAAAYDLRGKLLELAGDVFEVSPDDLEIVDGEFVSLDGALREPIAEVTGKLGKAQLVGTGSRGPNPDGMRVNTFGCQIAQVAVDVATGEIKVERIVAVHDIGRVIRPLQARSQVEGGMLQGLGFALMEERVVDPTTGTRRQRATSRTTSCRRTPTAPRSWSSSSTSPIRTPRRSASRASASRRSCRPRRRSRTPSTTRPACACARRRSRATASSRRAPDERLRPPGHDRRGARAARRARRAAARRRHRPRAAAAPRQGRRARSWTCAALLGDAIERTGDGLVIGAATRVADVAADAVIAERYAALAQAAGRGGLAAAAQSGHGRAATWPSTCAAGTSAIPT